MDNQGQNKGQTQPGKDPQILPEESRGQVNKGQSGSFQGQGQRQSGYDQNAQGGVGQPYDKGQVTHKAPGR